MRCAVGVAVGGVRAPLHQSLLRSMQNASQSTIAMTAVCAGVCRLLPPVAGAWRGCAHLAAFWAGLCQEERDSAAYEKALGENAPRRGRGVQACRIVLVGMFRLAETVSTGVREIGGRLMKDNKSHRHVPTGFFYKMSLSWL